MYLGAHAVLAIRLGHSIFLFTRATIKTGKIDPIGDGPLATRDDLVIVVGSRGFVTRDNTETRGKRS